MSDQTPRSDRSSGSGNGEPVPTSAVRLDPPLDDVADVQVESTGDPLVARNISVRFGGVRALTGVSITVRAGEFVGLIGSNGAGKTTLMDCISGLVQPARGSSIEVFGCEVVGMPPELRVYQEVGRSYQDARLFPSLTVQEAFLVALERHQPTGVLAAVFRLPGARWAERLKREWLEELIAMSGLGAFRNKFVGELSTGTRRVVDLMCLVAQGPRLLLLDEPSAGIAQAETEALAPLLLRLRQQLECSVLIVEHDMPLISRLCTRVYALEAGKVIAEGHPTDVLKDPKVIASYLGTDEAAILRSGARPAPATGNGAKNVSEFAPPPVPTVRRHSTRNGGSS